MDGEESAAPNKSAETRLASMLSGLGLKAAEFDAVPTDLFKLCKDDYAQRNQKK
ncbi:hypothetical protein [Deinococcus wulumuqiensis]|uniref:hypothetical protein n=1 Tax=Deinococcus wulumuqiensis TaxID=980427 RepID=UPI0013C37289|nr:hypothetical protein [Deinococcus wulumuqiensis]